MQQFKFKQMYSYQPSASQHQRYATEGAPPQQYMMPHQVHQIGKSQHSQAEGTSQRYHQHSGSIPLQERQQISYVGQGMISPSAKDNHSQEGFNQDRRKQLSTDLMMSRNQSLGGPPSSGVGSHYQVNRSIAEEFSQQHKVFKAATAKNQAVPRQQMKPNEKSGPYQPHHIPKQKSIQSITSSQNSQYRTSTANNASSIYNISQTSGRGNHKSISSLMATNVLTGQVPVRYHPEQRGHSLSTQIYDGQYPAVLLDQYSNPNTSSVQHSYQGTPVQNYAQNYYSQALPIIPNHPLQAEEFTQLAVPQFSQQHWQEMKDHPISIEEKNGARMALQQNVEAFIINEDSQKEEEYSSEMRDSIQSQSKEDSQSLYYMISSDFEQQAIERAQRIESIGRRPQLVPNSPPMQNNFFNPDPQLSHLPANLYGNQYPPQQAQYYQVPQPYIQPLLGQQLPISEQPINQLVQQNFKDNAQQSDLQTKNFMNPVQSQPTLHHHQGAVLQSFSGQGTPELAPNLSVLEHSIIRPQSGLNTHTGFQLYTSCTQLQNSHCSSSGNISSSWLSQSQSSQMQQTPSGPNKNSPPCQCINCLKAQMAQLQILLQQQQQMFYLSNQMSQGIPLAQTPPQKLSIPGQQQHIRQAKILNQFPLQQPTNSHHPPSSSSMLQNQSSSCWISSTSQGSPQSNSLSKVNRTEDRSTTNPGIQSSLTNSMATETMQSQRTMQQSTTPKKPIGLRGNEDETQLEERKSETEEEDSGSIPDEIDQLRSFNEKGYQEEIAYSMASGQNPLNTFGDSIKAGNEVPHDTQGEDQTTSEQYWNQQNGQAQMQNQSNLMRKNYIELPLGEIPEMKESFYDEASRWSHVFAANQSRNKTPDVMTSMSQQNLHLDKIMNSNSRLPPTSEANQSQSRQQYEEEKEDLFLYSQGESGATLNRSENENSFLTSEPKANSRLQDDYMNNQIKRQDGQQSSISFEGIRELSSVNESAQDKSTKLQMQSMLEPQTAQKDAQGTSGGHPQMMYPSSTDTKRPPLEYSASSAKYINQSLSFTPSQNGQSDQMEGHDCGIMDQKSISKLILKYDHLTPPKSNKRSSYPVPLQMFQETKDQKASVLVLDADLSSLQQHSQNFQNLTEEEQINAQREVLLSPLPPLPFSTESQATPEYESVQECSQQINTHQALLRRRIPTSSLSHYSSQIQRHSVLRAESYEKERENKIINYILNSDQKQGHHQHMKSSLIKGFHRPNVMSQVQTLFPKLEEILATGTLQNSQGAQVSERRASTIEKEYPFKSLEVKEVSMFVANMPLQEQGLRSKQIEREDAEIFQTESPKHSEINKHAAQLSYLSKDSQMAPKVSIGSEAGNPIQLKIDSQISKAIAPSQNKVSKIGDGNKYFQPKKTANTQMRPTRNEQSTFENSQSYLINSKKPTLFDASQIDQYPSLRVAKRFNSVESKSHDQWRRSSHSDNTRQQERSKSNGVKNDTVSNEKPSPMQSRFKLGSSTAQNAYQFASSRSRGRKQDAVQIHNSLSPYNGDKTSFGTSKLINKGFQQGQNQKTQKIKGDLSQTQIIKKDQFPKYSPTVFDRLNKTNQSLFQSQPTAFDRSTLKDSNPGVGEDLKHIRYVQPATSQQFAYHAYGTARDTSSKSRVSLERGVETRNSSCSSGAKSGPRKRTFSKIVFEISELPNVSVVNRSLSNKRGNDNILRNSLKLTQKGFSSKAVIHRKLEHPFGEEKAIEFGKDALKGRQILLGKKTSISPVRSELMHLQKMSQPVLQALHSINTIGRAVDRSTNRSYNSSTEFIVAHENFQIRQLTAEEAGQSEEGFQVNTVPNQTQESLNSRNYATNPLRTEELGDLSTTNILSTTQKDESASSRAIVQQLLSKNQHVGAQLQKLFGHRMNSKNSSLISDINIVQDDHQQPINPLIQTSIINQSQSLLGNNSDAKQKQSPFGLPVSRRFPQKPAQQSPLEVQQKRIQKIENYKDLNQIERGRPQATVLSSTGANRQEGGVVASKVCLPNSIFFNQSQKVNIQKILQHSNSQTIKRINIKGVNK
ncbi:hypothetical protein FGO68_gene9425 [Halteria grandinella]|uniref:Uncharacterized protein n=1 Tax=Halteria grandinella TaxID=5974 RepID=A0A8J8P7W4_HALGN|nr:hypothetical protein FGO68_gene9425 [Halteria grandinella]